MRWFTRKCHLFGSHGDLSQDQSFNDTNFQVKIDEDTRTFKKLEALSNYVLISSRSSPLLRFILQSFLQGYSSSVRHHSDHSFWTIMNTTKIYVYKDPETTLSIFVTETENITKYGHHIKNIEFSSDAYFSIGLEVEKRNTPSAMSVNTINHWYVGGGLKPQFIKLSYFFSLGEYRAISSNWYMLKDTKKTKVFSLTVSFVIRSFMFSHYTVEQEKNNFRFCERIK